MQGFQQLTTSHSTQFTYCAQTTAGSSQNMSEKHLPTRMQTFIMQTIVSTKAGILGE